MSPFRAGFFLGYIFGYLICMFVGSLITIYKEHLEDKEKE